MAGQTDIFKNMPLKATVDITIKPAVSLPSALWCAPNKWTENAEKMGANKLWCGSTEI